MGTPPVHGIVALAACLIFWILLVMKDANSLQALVDSWSEATGTGGFFSMVIISEKKDCLDLFSSRLEI